MKRLPIKRLPITVVAALLAVALTGTAVLAAQGPHVFGPRLASSPTIVPDEPEQTADPTLAVKPAETEKATDTDETETDADASAHPSNHGQIVSEAAHASTPAGCKNHGQYVSGVARGVIDPSVTAAPSMSVCDAASSTPGDEDSSGQGKGHGNSKAPKPAKSHRPD